MPRKCVCVALVAIFALAASRSAQAQVTVDVTKVNCDQFVHHAIGAGFAASRWTPPPSGLLPPANTAGSSLSRSPASMMVHQIGRQGWEAIIVALSPTVFDRNVLAIHEPGFFQTLEEILQREMRQVVR